MWPQFDFYLGTLSLGGVETVALTSLLVPYMDVWVVWYRPCQMLSHSVILQMTNVPMPSC